MTPAVLMVLAILAAAIFLFVSERIRPDTTALVVMVSLVLVGVLDYESAFAGFSNEGVITVASVLILSGALARTGVANIIGDRVLRVAGTTETTLVLALMVTVGLLSGFMNDIGVTALLLPVVVDLARRIDRPPSKLLIPLAFGSLLGGMTTLIGTAPNVLISGALAEAGYAPFDLFDFSPIGYAVLAGGTLYMVTVGRRLLPHRRAPDPKPAVSPKGLGRLYGIEGVLFAVTIPEGSALANRTLEESRLGAVLGVTVLSVRRAGRRQLDPEPEFRLAGGDKLLLSGSDQTLRSLQAWLHLEVHTSAHGLEELARSGLLFGEVTIPGRVAGSTLAEWDPRGRWGLTVLGIRHGTNIRLTHLSEPELVAGDRLLVVGEMAAFKRMDRKLRPDGNCRELPATELEREYRIHRRLIEVEVPEGSHLAGLSLTDSHLGHAFGANVVGIRRCAGTIWLPSSHTLLEEGDVLLVEGRKADFELLEALQELQPRAPVSTVESLSTEKHGFAEFMLAPRSRHLGATIQEIRLREQYSVSALAIWRGARSFRTGLAERRIKLGDVLLLHGRRSRIDNLAHDPEFICLSRADATPIRRHRAPAASGIMAGVLGLVITGVLPIYVAAPTGALAMILSRAITMQEAYAFISWRAVFLIAGMLGLGRAMETSGAAELIASTALGSLASFGAPAVVAGLFLITALSAQVMPTAAVAVLMAPIGLSTAANLGLSPQAVLMAVAIASSCAFLSPVGHPVNLLVMGAGGYRFTDYARVGFPLLLVVFLITMLLLPMIWPLRGG